MLTSFGFTILAIHSINLEITVMWGFYPTPITRFNSSVVHILLVGQTPILDGNPLALESGSPTRQSPATHFVPHWREVLSRIFEAGMKLNHWMMRAGESGQTLGQIL